MIVFEMGLFPTMGNLLHIWNFHLYLSPSSIRYAMESPMWPSPRDASQEEVYRSHLLVLSSIAARNTNGVVISDARGRIEWVNRSFEEMSGYTLGELKGEIPGHILQGPGTSAETVAYLSDRIRKREPFVCEILNYHKSGRPYWVRLLGQALLDDDGNVLQYFSIEEDITRLKASEEALHASEGRYRDLVENISEIVFDVDEAGIIRYVSPAAEKILGFPPSEITGKGIALITGRTEAQQAERIRLLAEQHQLLSEQEISGKDGRSRWFRISSRAVFRDGIFCGGTGTMADITELKNIQIELERLSLVASSNRLGVHFTDSDLRITYANDALLELTGYSREEIIGKRPAELFHGPLTEQSGISVILSGNENMVPVETDNIAYRKDGTWFWANLKKQPVIRAGSGRKEFFTIIEDITERKLAADILQTSENRLSTLIISMKEGILLENENHRIVLTNQPFCDLFGIPASPDELTGADCSQSAEQNRHLFRDPEGFVKRIAEILSERKSVLSEELELADGRFFDRDYIPLLFGNDLRGHLWKYADITTRKSQERNLLQKEEKYRNIIANMKLGLLETDNDDIIQYVNQQFCELSGYTVSELLGKHSVDLLVTDASKQTVKDKSASRADGISDTYEMQVRTKSGDIRWWLTSGGPNFNDRGKMVGTIGISLDITERKMHEAELQIAREKAVESARAKEIFLASMSHEIRTPLNAIIGLVREIAREPLSPKQERYIRNAGLASQHLLSIVNDILDITKIESGQLNLEVRTFSMQQLIDTAAAILMPEAVDKNLDFNVDTGPGLSQAYIGDGNRIKQVLLNILNNAIKFTDKGSVSISCDAVPLDDSRHRVSIRVADTGIGMEPAFLEHIFDKFSQGEVSTARRYGGTGLGLSITHELVQLMGGNIEVSSVKGEGSHFTVVLDLEAGDPANLEPDASAGSFSVLKGRSVLLVEDNDLNRLVAENCLVHCGMRVTGAHNGAEALEILRERRFDIILMDLQMPIMNGLDATTFLRKEMEIKTPVIALTANAFKAELDRCLEAGMNDYITKPFEESVLLASILRNIGPASATAPRGTLPAVDGEPLYNLDYIVQFSRDNPEFVRKMVALFVEQVPASVAEIQSSLESGNLMNAAAVAHRIKPNIDSFGIVSLKQEIRDLEARAQEKAPAQELKALAGHIREVIDCVVQQLKKDVL